jgi:MerR family transcriptional regulator/heat shock protein HspR
MNSAVHALGVFVPEAGALVSLDMAAYLARMSRHAVLVCRRRGLTILCRGPGYGGLHCNQEAVRTLQRIEYLRSTCGMNLTGIAIILKLMTEVEELRALVRR